MSQSSDDMSTGMSTGPVTGRSRPAQQTPRSRVIRPRAATAMVLTAPGAPARRCNLAGDLTAAGMMIVALFLPWNLYFGVGIPHSNASLFVVLLAVTLLSLVAVAAAGSWKSSGARFNPRRAGRIRVVLNVPYWLLVLAFVGFDVFETVRFGGTVAVPGGVGPGGWVGIAGSLLSAQPGIAGARTGPVPEGDEPAGWLRAARIIGCASMVGAVLSFCFNLYWRVRYALQSTGGADAFGKQNIAVIATALVYGVVALVAVLVASRWLVRGTRATRLAAVALGASTLAAGIIVWILPAGRDIDAFHGIAQNTSTAGVGFEGYLAWAAAAAIFAPGALSGRPNTSATEKSVWRAAARKGLLLIIVWCSGSMAMRITDLGVAVSLDYPFSRYDTMVLAGFDLATAVLAIWLRINLANGAVSARLITSLCGVVAALSVARVVVGVALAPRFAVSPNSAAHHPVYGNDLAEQITSIFDVTLCGLALCILAAVVITGHLAGRRLRRPKRPATGKRAVPADAGPPSAAAITRTRTGPGGADIPRPGRSPRIFGSQQDHDTATPQTPVQQPKIYRPPTA